MKQTSVRIKQKRLLEKKRSALFKTKADNLLVTIIARFLKAQHEELEINKKL